MPSSSHTFDRLDGTFDDDHAVADAGRCCRHLLEHLNAEVTADAVVSRGYRPGRKVITVLAGLGRGLHRRPRRVTGGRDRSDLADAVCELAIRDFKHGAGLIHCPSGVFTANAA